MPRPPLSRRTALGALGVTAGAATIGSGLAGCSASSTVDSLKAPTPATPTPSIDPDITLVAGVVAAMRSADRGAPRAFAVLHEAHASAFGQGAPADTPPTASPPTDSPSPGASPRAAGGWQQQQKALPETLTRAALSARDADLVRLFASAAAAQRQLLTARGLG